MHFQGEQKARKILAIVWIINKKTYNMVLQRQIIDCIKMNKISDDIKFIDNTIENWRVGLTAEGRT